MTFCSTVKKSGFGMVVLSFLLQSCLVLSMSPGTSAFAQEGFGGLGLPTVGGPAFGGPPVEYTASYELEEPAEDSLPTKGRLHVVAEVAPGFHTYSTTQKDGPLPTKIAIQDELVQIQGKFVPDHKPELGENEVWPDVVVEQHHGTITWTAPIEFAKPLENPKESKIAVRVDGLVCKSACQPVNADISAEFAGYYATRKPGKAMGPPKLRIEGTHAVWSAELSAAQVQAGGALLVRLTAATDPDYHVYEFVPGDEETAYRTLIVATEKSGLLFGSPSTETHLEPLVGLAKPIYFYEDSVTWEIPVHIPDGTPVGSHPIELTVGFMTCNDRSCDPPAGITVHGDVVVGAESNAVVAPMGIVGATFADAAGASNLANWIDGENAQELAGIAGTGADATVKENGEKNPDGGKAQAATSPLTLWHVLAGLAGGFILNFMPCVLPVIGLKIMSFVNQAGNSHRRVVTLNLSFVGGILLVMIALALVTVIAKMVFGIAFGWGQQFTVLEFKVFLAALVFAMALSFLGVWEIPIPGFATSSKSGELMEKEGHWGAFLKGVLTTVLATPCSGPLLGSLFSLSLVLSPSNVILLYLIVGLGMSLPYLVLCLSPGLINLLPKPGPWMDTLKQALAFPLLLTAVFFVASIDNGHRIATLILLIVVWFACWLVGRVPAYAERDKKAFAWASGLGTIAAGIFVAFSFFGPIKSDLPWVPYSEIQLAQLRQSGKTVMIDFTANWCFNCQLNTRVAIEKVGVAEVVKENDVVPMLADWTEPSEEIRRKLDELQSNSIPLMVIYPADPSAEPILLRDLLTEAQVIEALRAAGPSLEPARLTSAVD